MQLQITREKVVKGEDKRDLGSQMFSFIKYSGARDLSV